MPTKKKTVVAKTPSKPQAQLPTGTEVDPAHVARFSRLCAEAMLESRPNGSGGIGTLQEKRLHAIIKRYICEDTSFHEVVVAGTRFVSDVRIGNEIYEVQTGAFYPMKKKIEHYLTATDCRVTVIHPIPLVKYVSWVDPETQELSPRKRSPRAGRAEELLAELYSLLPSTPSDRLRFRLLFLEVQDFRLLNGWSRDRKKGSNRYERMPLALFGELSFDSPQDFRRLIPNTLPQHFTVKQFSDLTRLRGRDAYSAVRTLAAMGLFTPAAPIGRAMAWEITHPQET